MAMLFYFLTDGRSGTAVRGRQTQRPRGNPSRQTPSQKLGQKLPRPEGQKSEPISNSMRLSQPKSPTRSSQPSEKDQSTSDANETQRTTTPAPGADTADPIPVQSSSPPAAPDPEKVLGKELDEKEFVK